MKGNRKNECINRLVAGDRAAMVTGPQRGRASSRVGGDGHLGALARLSWERATTGQRGA